MEQNKHSFSLSSIKENYSSLTHSLKKDIWIMLILSILLLALSIFFITSFFIASLNNVLIFLLNVNCFIILIDLFITSIRHFNNQRKLLLLNHATLENFGYTDHYLYKEFKKVFSNILVVLITFGLYFSIIIIFLQSINDSKLVTEWHGFTFKWYAEMFANRSLNNAIFHTLMISILATICSTLLGTLFAVGIFYSSKRLREHILLLNNFPLLNADIVTGISLMLIFSLFITIDPYFFGWRTMLLGHLFFCLPYVILSVLGKLRELDPSIVDASMDLGIRPVKTLRKIIIPACKSGILSGMVLAFTMSFDDFVISYYTTGNGFDNLSIWIYSSIGRKSLNPSVYAFSCLVIFICIITLLTIWLISFKNKKKGKK